MSGQPVVIEEAAEMRAYARDQRRQGRSIGFVPTMASAHGDLPTADDAGQHSPAS